MKLSNVITFAFLMLISSASFAAAGAGGGAALPWEEGLAAIAGSMTGPVAYAVSVIGIVIAAGILIFGNDLNSFGRTVVFLVLVASVIVGAANALQAFTGVGATATTHSMAFIAMFISLAGGMTAIQETVLRVFKKRDNKVEIVTAA